MWGDHVAVRIQGMRLNRSRQLRREQLLECLAQLSVGARRGVYLTGGVCLGRNLLRT